MTKVNLFRFDGGLSAFDISDASNQQNTSGGFDIFAEKFGIKRLRIPSEYDTQNAGSTQMIFDACKRDTDGRVMAVGQTSSTNSAFRFYRKNGNNFWTQSLAAGIPVANNSAFAVLFRGEQYGFACTFSQAVLYRYDTDSLIATLDTISDSHPSSIAPAPIVHSQDNTLYYAYGKTIRKYVSGISGVPCITLPDNITSICEYGPYLAIACQSATNGTIYLWGRDTTLTTFQDKIYVSTDFLKIIDVIDGYLVSVSESPYEPNFSNNSIIFSPNYAVKVRMYTGGTMKLISETNNLGFTEGGTNHRLRNKKQKRDGFLFFSTGSNYLMKFGLNKLGQYVLSWDQQIAHLSSNITELFTFFLLGDYTYSCQTNSVDSNRLTKTEVNPVYASTALYETTINPNMLVEDWHKDKVLNNVTIKGSVLNQNSAATLTLKYSVDNSVFVTIMSQTQPFYSNVFRFETFAELDSLPFKTGRDFRFRVEVMGLIDIDQITYEYDDASPQTN